VLRRRRWQIVMPAIYVLALGTVFAVLVPKKDVISTRVELLEGPGAETNSSLTQAGPSAVQREVDNIAIHLTNYTRISEVVREEQGLWPEYMTADAVDRKKLIERIQDDLKVDQLPKSRNMGSTFVDIEYRDVSGDRAVTFLKDLIEKWVDEVVQRDKHDLEEERQQFQDQTAEALRALQEARKKLTDLAREMGVDPVILLAGGKDTSPTDPIDESLQYVEER